MNKYQIDKNCLEQLKDNPKTTIITKHGLMILTSFEYVIEKKTIKKWFSKPIEIEEIYLTEISLYAWHKDNKVWGILDFNFACNFVYWNNLSKLRKDYLNIKESLLKLGYEIKKVEEKDEKI